VYFDSHPELFVKDGLMLHIAPEHGLGRKLSAQARQSGMRYRDGGITGIGEKHIDLLDLPMDDASVTLVYCCHVLNSLQDDRVAMNEVFRVLHPDGVAILQVPAFHQGSTTVETHGLAERMSTFGDEGIYRCYTNDDYEARLRAAGFQVKAFRADDVGDDLVQRFQLKREVLHLCRKPGGILA
jgi:SAM-dependent methyltransferase